MADLVLRYDDLEYCFDFDISKEECDNLFKLFDACNPPGETIDSICFFTKKNYTSFKSLYEEYKIDKKIIKGLEKKKIIISKYNSNGKGSVGIFFCFTKNSNFVKNSLKRKVIIEKIDLKANQKEKLVSQILELLKEANYINNNNFFRF